MRRLVALFATLLLGCEMQAASDERSKGPTPEDEASSEQAASGGTENLPPTPENVPVQTAPAAVGDTETLPCTEVTDSFDGALDTTKFALNGSAAQVAAPRGGKHIRLTPNAQNQTGSIVYRNPVGEHFTVSFSLFITAPAGGGDGMALQFLTGKDATALGKGGGDLGLSPLVGYGVTFDTSRNPERGETDGNHISLVDAADLKASASTSKIPLLDAGTYFPVVVDFDAGDVTVTMNKTKILTGKVPNYVKAPILVGFSGATGFATNVHVIDDLKITCRGSQ
jgi:hypothetical protein